MSLNEHRRHLTTGQGAMCGTIAQAKFAEEIKQTKSRRARERKEAKKNDQLVTIDKIDYEDSRKIAADLVGASTSRISIAKKVQAHSHDLADKVRMGQVTLPQAAREVNPGVRSDARSAPDGRARLVPTARAAQICATTLGGAALLSMPSAALTPSGTPDTRDGLTCRSATSSAGSRSRSRSRSRPSPSAARRGNTPHRRAMRGDAPESDAGAGRIRFNPLPESLPGGPNRTTVRIRIPRC